MSQLNNAMEIFKILPRTNCGKCRIPTCLAFAAAAFKGDKALKDCPHLDRDTIEDLQVDTDAGTLIEQEQEEALEMMRQKVADMNLSTSATRLGGTYAGNKLTVKMLGKDFSVDSNGNVTSACHTHAWLTMPLLDYVLSCEGVPVSGKWVPFRELENGATWSRLFGQRAEKPLKQVADIHSDLFELMIQIFSAEPAPNAFESDIAVVLHPLPRLPMLICYWKPDDGLESDLNLFFDDTAEENVTVDSLYRIAAGMVVMFEKIADTHG